MERCSIRTLYGCTTKDKRDVVHVTNPNWVQDTRIENLNGAQVKRNKMSMFNTSEHTEGQQISSVDLFIHMLN